MTRLTRCALVLNEEGYAKYVIPCEEPDPNLEGNVLMADVETDRLFDIIRYVDGVLEYTTPQPREEPEPEPTESDIIGAEVVAMKVTIAEQADLIDALGKELTSIKLKGVEQ